MIANHVGPLTDSSGTIGRLLASFAFSAMLLLGSLFTPSSFSQTQCQQPPNNSSANPNGKPSGWRQNTTVNVYIDTNQYDTTQRAAIKDGFNNWAGADNANVSYNFVEQAGPPVPTGNYVIVKKEDPGSGNIGSVTWNQTDAGSVNYVDNATMSLHPTVSDPSLLSPLTAHETGHLHFLDDCPSSSCPTGTSVMSVPIVEGSNTGPTSCDADKSNQTSGYSAPDSGGGGGGIGGEGGGTGDEIICADPFRPLQCSPIVMAVGTSSTYELTDWAGGVRFDLNSDGAAERLPWTSAGQPIGFLALDRNHNGVIDNGRELFGNYTPLESDQSAANGFEALAYWDRPEAGGNGDGWIDARDAVWAELRIWIDANHDGLTQPGELFHPSAFSISAISLAYMPEMRQDQYGNLFRYRSEFVIGVSRRMCYDVFLGAR